MLGSSMPGSGAPLSPSHARPVGCSSAASPRTSSRPLAMAEIFSFWAAARFSKNRALRDRVGHWPGPKPHGDDGDEGQTTPCHTAQPALQHRKPLCCPHHSGDSEDSTSSREEMPPQPRDKDAAAPREPKAHAVRVPPSRVGPNRSAARCHPHPKAAKPRRAPGQKLVGTLRLLVPWVARAQMPPGESRPEEAHGWRHTHASTYSNFLKMGLSPRKEGASSRLREKRG